MSDLPYLDITAPGFSTRGREVLEARAIGWCARTPYGLAVLRHHQAGMLLRDRRLRQGSHAWPETIGINGTFADFWRRSVISREGEAHRRLRRVAQAALAQDYVESLKPEFESAAKAICAGLPGTFDFIDAFSEPFAGRAIAALLGEPEDDARALARDATTLGLAMGPDAPTHETAVNAACARLLKWASRLLDRPTAGSYVARLMQAAETDYPLLRQEMIDLIVISIFGGVDTTRAQLGFAMLLFARHPDQWTWLRNNIDAVPQAIEEVIRTRPTTTWATREALEDFEFHGIQIHAGQTLHILVHPTSTDPAAGPWDGFDIRTPRKMHFGFGGGAHHCLGQLVARADMAAALRVLLQRWRAIRLVEEPSFLPDSGNTSPLQLIVAPELN